MSKYVNNMIIEEAYVSYELAKLLKEKGFDVSCLSTYDINNGKQYFHTSYIMCATRINAPTLQMACRWLREVHNLCVVVDRTACGYIYLITRIPSGTDIVGDAYNGDDEDSGQWTTWEGACEAGIMYCVKNLI